MITPSPLVAVFDAYGEDAEAGLAALANTDPPFWHAYTEAAVVRQYRSDYAKHRRTLTLSVAKENLATDAGQARLFEVDESEVRVKIREVLTLDGREYPLLSLAGEDGAAVLRKVAQRDLGPARTTVARCRQMERLGDHLSVESSRLHREVTVAEVLGVAS